MNYRDYKEFAPGEFFHVYNRGVGKMKIFKDEEDIRVFLFRLWENLFPDKADRSKYTKSERRRKSMPPDSFDLISYCLMPNHFHLLIKQNKEVKISELILKVCTGYSKYFNQKYDRVGTLFQDRFKAVLIENNEQLLWVSLYIHNNPFRAEIVKDLADYKWSSYLDYIGIRNGNLCKKDHILEQYQTSSGYVLAINNLKDDKFGNKLIVYQDLLIDSE